MIPESKGLNPHKLAHRFLKVSFLSIQQIRLNPHKLAHRWGLLTPTSYNADTKNIKAIIP